MPSRLGHGLTLGPGAGAPVLYDATGKLPAVDGSQLLNLPASGIPDWTQIAIVTISSPITTVNFTAIPQTYKELLVQGLDFVTGSSSTIVMSVSANGSTYSPSATTVSGGIDTATSPANILMHILNYTKDKSQYRCGASAGITSPNQQGFQAGGLIVCAGGLKNIRLMSSAGNINSGSFILYGR